MKHRVLVVLPDDTDLADPAAVIAAVEARVGPFRRDLPAEPAFRVYPPAELAEILEVPKLRGRLRERPSREALLAYFDEQSVEPHSFDGEGRLGRVSALNARGTYVRYRIGGYRNGVLLLLPGRRGLRGPSDEGGEVVVTTGAADVARRGDLDIPAMLREAREWRTRQWTFALGLTSSPERDAALHRHAVASLFDGVCTGEDYLLRELRYAPEEVFTPAAIEAWGALVGGIVRRTRPETPLAVIDAVADAFPAVVRRPGAAHPVEPLWH